MPCLKKRFEELRTQLTYNGQYIFPGALLQRAAHLWPQRTALICEQQTITLYQLYQTTIPITRLLKKLGLKPDDRALIIYENSINFYQAYYGAWQTGAIIVPINTYLHAKEIEAIINDCKPSVILVSKKQRKKIEALHLTIPIISDEMFEKKATETRNEQEQLLPDLTMLIDNDQTCVALLYTSGTTGTPKGVMLSSKNIITNTMQGIANFYVTSKERVYAALPLFHSFMQNAAIWSPLVVGAAVIIIPTITRSALLAGLKHKPTALLGIPQLFALLCLIKKCSFSHVRYCISGGDTLHNKIRMGFELLYQRKIANGYGLTESSPFVSVDLDDYHKPSGCVGKPLHGIAIAIKDSTHKTVEQGKKGLLWIKGDQVMLGYYNAPEATAQVLHDGWLNTGDLAYVTTRGEIVLCGREKDIIIHNGFNIYPTEIENILTTHPAVLMAAVIAQTIDEKEIPVAFVVTKYQNDALSNELKELCKHNLAPYKIPVHFYLKKELPMTATGKIDKKALRTVNQ